MAIAQIFFSVFERDHVAKGGVWMVWTLIGLFVAVFGMDLLLSGGLDQAARAHGFIPARAGLGTALAALFMHAGVLHLAANCFFLWMYGDNIEEKLGPWALLGLFVITGLVATGAHWLAQPASILPTVGASGGISGLMGFYALKFPNATLVVAFGPWLGKKKRLLPLGSMRAWIAMALWFVGQGIAAAIAADEGSSSFMGVAVWAHIGGAFAGVALALAGLAGGWMRTYPRDGIHVEPVKKEIKAKPKPCRECGTLIRRYKRICGNCGKQLPVRYQ